MKKMKTLKMLSLLIVLISGITLTNCGKKGCTDSNATNYCDKCKKDDGTCTYKATVQFWYNQTTANDLVAIGSTSLTYYIDGVIIGSSAANVYFAGDPNCTQSGVVRLTKDLGTSKTKSAAYVVKDDFGDIIWEGNVTFDSKNTCFSIQLQ